MSGPDTLQELLTCAHSWEPDARLLGNATAAEIITAIETAIRERDAFQELYERLRDATRTEWKQLFDENEQLRAQLDEALHWRGNHSHACGLILRGGPCDCYLSRIPRALEIEHHAPSCELNKPRSNVKCTCGYERLPRAGG